MNLKQEYTLANCCKPAPGDKIIGYYSFDNVLKVHKADCPNLFKADPARLVQLNWKDILAPVDFRPESDFTELTQLDFKILKHHSDWGADYSLKVASMHHLEKQTVFDIHLKLRQMGLLNRVRPVMMQYRKGIAKNKWIKHRNHTYYELTDKGRDYLDYYLKAER
jgi:(p)ppGpp synthase/HD superfamily hydrolase